ncbi:MAG: hypothetical protein KDJ27_20395, partial [Gammaproteobacteria bacterium]|nr:hypothetical protein [Gammaproteobacteria bacterium]
HRSSQHAAPRAIGYVLARLARFIPMDEDKTRVWSCEGSDRHGLSVSARVNLPTRHVIGFSV